MKVSGRYGTYLRRYESVKLRNVIFRENLTFDLTSLGLFICVYWGFRARRLLGSLCAHKLRYAREEVKIYERDSQFMRHNQVSKQLGFGFRR